MTIILPGTNLEPFFLIPKLRLNETMKKKWQKAQHGKPEFCVEQKKIETWFEKKNEEIETLMAASCRRV